MKPPPCNALMPDGFACGGCGHTTEEHILIIDDERYADKSYPGMKGMYAQGILIPLSVTGIDGNEYTLCLKKCGGGTTAFGPNMGPSWACLKDLKLLYLTDLICRISLEGSLKM